MPFLGPSPQHAVRPQPWLVFCLQLPDPGFPTRADEQTTEAPHPHPEPAATPFPSAAGLSWGGPALCFHLPAGSNKRHFSTCLLEPYFPSSKAALITQQSTCLSKDFQTKGVKPGRAGRDGYQAHSSRGSPVSPLGSACRQHHRVCHRNVAQTLDTSHRSSVTSSPGSSRKPV